MGERGKKPSPRELMALKGSRPRHPGAAEVDADGQTPDAPAWLTPAAAACWASVTPQLAAMGVLSRIDQNSLARYCTLWDRWRAAEQYLAENGETYPLYDDLGRVKYWQQFPQVSIAQQLSLQLGKLETEFGMTPSARSRIVVAPSSTPKNAIMDFIGK